MRKGQKHSKETRKKMSKSSKLSLIQGRKSMPSRKGISHTEDWKKNASKRLKKQYAEGKRKKLTSGGVTAKKISRTLKKKYDLGILVPNNTTFKKGQTPWNFLGGRDHNIKLKHLSKQEWKKIREYILKRDNHTCQNCGKKNVRLEVHHKNPFLDSFNNSFENLISLCRSCHVKIDARIIKKKRRNKNG